MLRLYSTGRGELRVRVFILLCVKVLSFMSSPK